MIDRLGKKPISEGYLLWDKNFLLGALRLFQCKLEVAPPFEVAPCFEAVGDILYMLEEKGEAAEHYDLGQRKFGMMSKKWGAHLLSAKHCRASEGDKAALAQLEKILKPFDEAIASQGVDKAKELIATEAKGEVATVGSMYSLRAQCAQAEGVLYEYALGYATYALAIGCDRPHATQFMKGEIYLKLEKETEAEACFNDSVTTKPCWVLGYEELLNMYTRTERHADALAVANKLNKEHPKADYIRDEAFATAGTSGDAAALKLLDEAISAPPTEEGEDDGTALAILYKAKAAIYADSGDFPNAVAALRKVGAGDEQAECMIKQIIEICPEAAGSGGASDEEAAAQKIQALQRGRQGRKKADEKRKEVKEQVAVAKEQSGASGGGAANQVVSLEPGSPSVHDVSGTLHREGELRELFNAIDKNGNGWLNEAELTSYYMSIDHFGIDPDPTFVQRQLKEFGGDGRVTFDEFAVILLRIAAR